VQDALLSGDPETNDVRVTIVWIDMLADDSANAAASAKRMFDDGRVTQFHDQQRIAGKAFARSLGWPAGTAWDVYMFYESAAVWDDAPPAPAAWAHQLAGHPHADASRYRRGEALVEELRRLAGESEQPSG